MAEGPGGVCGHILGFLSGTPAALSPRGSMWRRFREAALLRTLSSPRQALVSRGHHEQVEQDWEGQWKPVESSGASPGVGSTLDLCGSLGGGGVDHSS